MEVYSIQIEKEEMKLSLFTDGIIIYVEKPIELIKKTQLFILRSHNRKVIKFKINIQKSITFLYTRNEQVKFEIKKNTIYIISPQN